MSAKAFRASQSAARVALNATRVRRGFSASEVAAVLAVLGILIVIGLVSVRRFQQATQQVSTTAEASTTLSIGELAPDFSFTDLEGNSRRLSDFRGKPVLLDFWATWCGPCIRELPTLRAVHAELKDKGFVVLSLSMDTEIATAKGYVAQNDMPWTHGWSPGGWQNEAAEKFGVHAIPSVWLIGADGRINATNLRGEKTKAAARLLLEGK